MNWNEFQFIGMNILQPDKRFSHTELGIKYIFHLHLCTSAPLHLCTCTCTCTCRTIVDRLYHCLVCQEGEGWSSSKLDQVPGKLTVTPTHHYTNSPLHHWYTIN